MRDERTTLGSFSYLQPYRPSLKSTEMFECSTIFRSVIRSVSRVPQTVVCYFLFRRSDKLRHKRRRLMKPFYVFKKVRKSWSRPLVTNKVQRFGVVRSDNPLRQKE